MPNNSTGPRTPQGKANSSRNATKHMIFVPRVLPGEEEAAALLYDEICSEFHMNGGMEFKIARDLVQNELEADRIEKFAVKQFIKAPRLAACDLESINLRYAPTLRPPIPKEKQAQAGYCTRMRPAFCAAELVGLKARIERRGLQPNEDLELLRLIYGNEVSLNGQAIVAYYTIASESEHSKKVGEKAAERKNTDPQGQLLESLQLEIEVQEALSKYDEDRKVVELASEGFELPPDHIFDQIEKYRTANARRPSRLLAELETIRRLKAAA